MCGTDGNVHRFRVSREEPERKTVSVDLCAEHSSPLEAVFDARPVPKRRRRQVTPLESVPKKRTARKRS